MVQVLSGAESFFFKHGEVGCLLVHGGTGTPAVMKKMGKYLAENGISSFGVRLKGFGTSVDDWLKTNHLDWIVSAEDALKELEKDCKSIFVSGLSMGASLALFLAGKHQGLITGAISICAPLGPYFLEEFRSHFIPLAEKTGLISEIGYYVIKKSCEALHKWQTRFNLNLSMSINLSPLQLDESDLINRIVKQL